MGWRRETGGKTAALQIGLRCAQRGAAHTQLQFAERYCYWAPGGSHGWGQTAEEAHQQGEDYSGEEQAGRDLEGECQMREGLPVHGAGGQAVQGKDGDGTDSATDKGN